MPDRLEALWEHPGKVHLVGAGGVGMAGLARLFLQGGFRVTGSDSALNRLCRELQADGAALHAGHAVAQVPTDIDWAVRTPAVAGDNPEVTAARNRGIPVYSRGQVLAAYTRRRSALAVAGAHGKTTTSAMLAHMLRKNGVDCGYAIGGETALPHRVADAGSSDWFVCEADESDGSLVHYQPVAGVLTHVEWDHVERFATEKALLSCYRCFVRRCESLWLREDDTLAMTLGEGKGGCHRVGVSEACRIRLMEQEDDPLGQRLRLRVDGRTVEGRIPLPGRHNAWNAALALGAALETGVDAGCALGSLQEFHGVGRRFQRLNVNGITLIQDYAHHPTEIRAVLVSARALKPKKLRVVFQPHRFSRTRHLLDPFAASFAGVDRLDLLPVYAASELPGQGVGSPALAERCVGIKTRQWTDRRALADALAGETEAGDVILILGAGDVGMLQAELAERILDSARR